MNEVINNNFSYTFLDLCTVNPCNNGGSCEIDGDSFKCTCQTPYKGRTCEKGIKYLKTQNFKLKIYIINYISLKLL